MIDKRMWKERETKRRYEAKRTLFDDKKKKKIFERFNERRVTRNGCAVR